MGYKTLDNTEQDNSNPLATLGSFQDDPNFFNHKKLQLGESLSLRFFKLRNDDVVALDARKVTILNPKNGSPMNITVIYPGDEIAKDLVDAKGVRLIDAPKTQIFRAMVWAYQTATDVDKSGRPKNIEDIQDLRYIEFGMGLAISLNKMKDFQKQDDGSSVGSFNPDTNRPDYDVRLKVIAGNSASIPKNYEFEPIVSAGIDPKTKQPRIHPNFGKDTETALADYMDIIDEKWDAVRESMLAMPTEASIRRQFENRNKNNTAALVGSMSTSVPANNGSEGNTEDLLFPFNE